MSYIGDEVGALIKFLFFTCIISVPLGLWKLIEIIIWITNNVQIVIK